MNAEWADFLKDLFAAQEFSTLEKILDDEYSSKNILPEKENIFAAFDICPLSKLKVVIVGQDPYPTPNVAHGLAFSVTSGTKIPRSLVNIFTEISSETGASFPETGALTRWAEQGVLLMNSILTVRANSPLSHKKIGWEFFTDGVIKCLNAEFEHLVFLLWGKAAQEKASFIDETRHLVLRAAHPSPLSARNGFFGCGHFSATNDYLTKNGLQPVIW